MAMRLIISEPTLPVATWKTRIGVLLEDIDTQPFWLVVVVWRSRA